NGRWLVTAGADESRLWDLLTPTPESTVFENNQLLQLPAVVFRPTSDSFIFSGLETHQWTILDDGRALMNHKLKARGTPGEQQLEMSRNGHWLARTSWGGLELYYARASEVLPTPIFIQDNSSGINSMVMTPDSDWLIVGY